MPLTDPIAVAAALAVIAATHWLGGIASFGSTLLALPALAWVMPLRDARTLLLLVGTLQAWQMIFYTYRQIDWRKLGWMVLLAGVGMPVGIAAMRYLPEQLLFVALGIVLIGSGLSQLCRTSADTKWPGWVLNGLLVAGGIVHGAFATGGALVVVSAQQIVVEKNAFRGTLNAFWVVLNSLLLVDLARSNAACRPLSMLLVLTLPVVLAATWLANYTARRMSQNQFVKLVSVLLVIAGVVTIARVLSRLIGSR